MATDYNEAELERLIEKQINLPSPPAIAVQILNTVQNQEASMRDLETIIAADPALTSKMLRIANSAFYALPNEVKNVTRALSILGTNVIKNIALSFVIAGDMRGDDTANFDFDYFWRRSVTSAVAAELVVKLLGRKDEDIFVTALLQDIGVLTFYLAKGADYAAHFNNFRTSGGQHLIQTERERYHFDHQQLGHLLLKSWQIPQAITSPMLFHHEPESAPPELQQRTAVLYVANLLSAIYSGTRTSANVRLLEKRMLELFNVDAATTKTLLDDVARKTLEVLQSFEIDPGQMKPYSQMLQEANDELGKLNLSYEQLVMELKESKEQSERFARELQEANRKLEELAFRDGLTGLYNHRYFQEIFDKELARAQRYNHHLSLILFDIDFFKRVNDTYGHPTGDKVLINLSQSIAQAIRPSDILARYGGEEFAVILPETNVSGMKVFAERLRRCAAQVMTATRSGKIQITISVGGSHGAPGEKVSKQALLDGADRALYLSKQEGRNRVNILPPDLKHFQQQR